ncbi:MAG TPA: HD-GYP domain-containing protein, partial [Armatimonadota bacterium]|nr:HD-GYP domain-containing protein [Armatimonadota bacterium]
SIVQALSNAIDVKDHGTHMHVKRVHTLAGAVARRVGLADEDLEAVETGAVLHDIGKLAVPDGVLNKPSRLTDEEFRLIQEHPAAGDAILRPINFGCDVATVVRHHHEKMDGSGYPDGISGDEISVGARVLAVIDIYDALVCDRPYRKAWTGEQALEQLRTEAGEGKLDATVVHALQEVIESGECADELTEDLGDDIWSTLPHLAPSAALDPEVETQIAQARVVEQTRRSILSGVVEYFAQDSVFQACVAYGVNERNGELDAVTAAGPLAESFAMARIPFGAGPSTHAVKSARPVAGASAADEFRCFSEGVPEGLSNCSVTAVPISDSSGQPIAVVSFYLRGGATLPERVVGELTGAMGVLGRQLEAAGDAMDADVRLPIDDSPLPGQLLAGG